MTAHFFEECCGAYSEFDREFDVNIATYIIVLHETFTLLRINLDTRHYC